jgi:hypothetical protein
VAYFDFWRGRQSQPGGQAGLVHIETARTAVSAK